MNGKSIPLRVLKSSAYIDTIAAAFITLFLYTGIEKLLSHGHFLRTLGNISLISNLPDGALLFSYMIPILEITTAIFLLVPKTKNIGLLISTILMLSFSIYVTSMLMTSSHLPCTCGGIVSWLTWKEHLILNATLTILGLTTILTPTLKNSRYAIPLQ